ncbi:MMPL family transporter [Amycolatopsis thailandensis]|uniref:MMPL family transporter n=1 Tax=Amycolatopsis thailandensis TaxID=589330 RepID=UPI00379C1979
MSRFSRFVVRHKLFVVLSWLVVTGFGLVATVLVDERLVNDFSLPGQPGYEANQEIQRTYGTGGDDPPLIAVVTLPTGSTVDGAGVREDLNRAFAKAGKELKARVTSYGDTGDRHFVGADGRTVYGVVVPKPTRGENADLTGKLRDSMTTALPPGMTVQVTGIEALASVDGTKGVSVLIETLLGGIGALLVLVWVFGSLLAFVPLLIAVCSIAGSFLLVFGLTEITTVSPIVQFIVALLGLGVAIDYSLLLVTRWREERGKGYSAEEAVHRAMATAGRAVIASAGCVGIGLLAMIFLPVPFLRSVGYGGMMIPLVSALAVLTLLPVLLAKAGHRLDWPRRRTESAPGRGWSAWARGMVRYRWVAATTAGLALAALAVFGLDIRLGQPASSSLAQSGPAYDALAVLRAGGTPTGVLTPIDVVVPVGTDPVTVAKDLSAVPGVYTAVAPDGDAWRRGGSALVSVLPVNETGTDAGRATITGVRGAAPPGAMVGGEAAQSMDFVDAVYGSFPLMFAIIAAITFLVLVRSFRSLLLPLKAVLLNLLSLGAILGTMVLVWQYGYGSDLLWDIPAMGALTEFIPVMIFAFLYGLSMDYEVFLLARMREEYDRTGSTEEAVVAGIGRTGRLVTSAALILFLAFASLAAAPQPEIKMFATGLGLGVLLDATLVRAVLVPAAIAVMGKWNWWLPGWVAKVLRVPSRKSDPELVEAR